ncbi:50S ribosomal protein L23 [Kiritimatiella glycovorans]|uniref:Large ribosomal subunit protein uL23 n=1 Tax=Kiritimatiella glycovorans TaxID=1307763 RepID=A0A0G3EJI7_9BACT|nr:50S ribosomal protein L23 [Kiritimatiella glycovorans]AKJ64955.1 50S ribosomal protein L23 [Kiritimatiella glycovorans]
MNSYHIIQRVLLTEKGTRLSETENKYIFRVHPKANKPEIKRAVEDVFGVHVEEVNTMNRKGKIKRERGLHFGRTAAWKRAVVTLREGEQIEII